jgi:4-amino-4-deoxy-L-arabinose transferase-like glycosyltransferase
LNQAADKKRERAAWAAALGFALFRLWYASRIQLSADEAYYWEWSRSLALSYYDQGPGLALAIRLGTALFGNNELGVRFMSVLCALLSSLLAIRSCALLKRPQAALWLVLAMNGMLLFSVGAVLMMHDSLMGFFWMLALFCALKAQKKAAWWLGAGLAAGCALLSKYTGALFFACTLLALATHKGLRGQLKSPWLWAGALLGSALGLIPILLWNFQNGWPSFLHVFSLAGGDASRKSLTSFPEFLGSQVGLVTPLLFFMVAGAWWRGRKAADSVRHLTWCYGAPVFLFFTALSLRSRVEGNWPAQAYLAGMLLVALDLDLKGRLAKAALVLAFALSALAYAQAARPFLPIPQKNHKLDSASRVDGWRGLAGAVEGIKAGLKGGSFVGCRTYQNAAELAFYLPGQARPLILQDGPINHQYRFWNRPEALEGKDAVLVVGQLWEIDEMRGHFRSVEEAGFYEVKRNGIVTQTFQLFIGKGFKP